MLVYMLIILGFAVRLLPYAPNMAPVAAIALFSGAYLDRKIAPWVPLIVMAVTDLIIGMHDVVLFTWGAFILIGFMGRSLRERKTPACVLGMTVFSSLVFFAISNLGVWLVWYPKTAAGIADCYIRALPFFRNTLVGNTLFALALFGACEAARIIAGESRYKTVLLTDCKKMN